MPKSRVRKKPVYTPPAAKPRRKVSAPWVAPAMLGCLIVGLVWIVLYYVTNSSMPVISTLGAWNLICGFGLIIVGVVLSTRWY